MQYPQHQHKKDAPISGQEQTGNPVHAELGHGSCNPAVSIQELHHRPEFGQPSTGNPSISPTRGTYPALNYRVEVMIADVRGPRNPDKDWSL
jgi:hypothetical protein